jgi:hypothetical protein
VNGRDLIARFRQSEVVDDVDIPRGPQLALLAELTELYEHEGLLGREPRPLWDCCPNAGECWKRAWQHRPRSGVDVGGISLPWVGPDYRRGGVVVVAINLRDASGLLVEYAITCATAGDSQITRLASGHRTAHHSRLAYGTARSAAAVLDSVTAREVSDSERPHELVEALTRTARLQAVKCSPADDARSTPTPAMRRHCPPLLLARELELLSPGCVLTFGDLPWRAIRNVPGYEETDWADHVSIGVLRGAEREATVYSLAHPATGLWDRGHAQLLAHLRGEPLLKR